MGLGDLFGKWGICPECRHRGAKISLGKVKCTSALCKKFDPQLVTPAQGIFKTAASKSLNGDFDPGPNKQTIKYRNYLGDDRIYSIDKTTLMTRGEYISARAVPTGKKIAFKKRFIKNLKEIEDCLNTEIEKELKSQREIIILYKNFKGKDMSFASDANSIRFEGERIFVKLIPSGRTFCLKKRNIVNFSEIERCIKK